MTRSPSKPDPIKATLEVVEAVGSLEEIDEFGLGTLEALNRVVPFDIGSYNEIDPEINRVVVSSVPPLGPEMEPAVAAFARLAHQNPILQYQRETLDGSPRRISDFLTQDQFHRLDLYREVYRRMDVEYQMAVGLPARQPLVVAFALNRHSRDFSDEEVDLVSILRPHLIQAYRNLRALSTYRAVAGGLESLGRSVLVLGVGPEEPLVASATDWSMETLERYFGPTSDGLLPTAVADWVTTQRTDPDGAARPPGTVAGPSRSRPGPVLRSPLVGRTQNGQLTARFVPGTASRPDMVILDEWRVQRGSLQLRELGLTDRESEILWMMTCGDSSARVAETLLVSPATVNKHLEHIYRKLGVTNRMAAVVAAYDAMSSDR